MSKRAATYDVIKDFETSESSHYAMQSPYWIVAVFRLGKPLSYSRRKQASVAGSVAEGVFLRGKPLIITDDCINLSVSNPKSGYTKTLNSVLKETTVNYLAEILPGDWVMSWMVNNKKDYDSLLSRLGGAAEEGSSTACNRFNDGLKFLGRAHSIRKSLTIAPDSGIKTVSISLQAVGFNELSTSFFYDPALDASNDNPNGGWLTKIGVDIRKLYNISKDGTNNIDRLIPAIIEIIVGQGASKIANPGADENGNSRNGSPPVLATAGGGTAKGAKAALMVPQPVGDVLGKTSSTLDKSTGYLSYADLMELWIGVQEFPSKESDKAISMVPRTYLARDVGDEDRGNTRFSGEPLQGSFLEIPTFVNKPIWEYLHQFLNPVINEMYTCLGPNDDGVIVPKLVVRQIPFTTDAFEYASPKKFAVTKFLDLPRWRIPPVIVSSIDLGRSDATRFNFVHVYAKAQDFGNAANISQQMALNKPIRDDIDIQRSGVRTYMQTVDCFVSSTQNKDPSNWMALIADRSMGSQYTLNGTIHCKGIQSPICEGDNIEFDNCVYHIESISHSCSISNSGTKTFNTILSLSNGMADSEDDHPLFPSYPGFKRYLSSDVLAAQSLDVTADRSGDKDTSQLTDEQFTDRKTQLEGKALDDEESHGSDINNTSNTFYNPGIDKVTK